MRLPALTLLTALAVGAAGCRNCSRVESQLAARESDVRVLKDELGKSEFLNHALTNELGALRGVPGPNGILRSPTEPYPVRSIALGGLTSGRPSETLGGDDALQVLVEPRDTESQAIKAPGTVYVEAFEVSPEGLKRPLSAWVSPPDVLRRSWQRGLFNSGYLLTFPWKVFPSTENLRVRVRFAMLDGRVFEADKDIRIRVVPEANRPRIVSPPINPPFVPVAPAPAPSVPVLPMPKQELPAPKVVPPPKGDILPPPLPDGPKLPPPIATLHRPIPWKSE